MIMHDKEITNQHHNKYCTKHISKNYTFSNVNNYSRCRSDYCACLRLHKSTKLAVRPGDIDAEGLIGFITSQFVIYGVKTACAMTTSITTDSKTSTTGFIHDLLGVKDDMICVCVY